MKEFLTDLWEFLKVRKKNMATTNCSCVGITWRNCRCDPTIFTSEFYLHLVLDFYLMKTYARDFVYVFRYSGDIKLLIFLFVQCVHI